MPLNARLSVVHRLGNWSNTVEEVLVGAKNDVSQVRNEIPTAGYGHIGRSEFAWEKTKRAAQLTADLRGGKPSGKKVEIKKVAHVNGNGTNGTNGNGTNGHAVSAKAGKRAKKAKQGGGKQDRFAEV